MRLTTIPFLIGVASTMATPIKAAKKPSMGFIGCSMSENVAQGYVANGFKHIWGPYGTGGLVVQSWTDTNSPSWGKFDQQVAKYGKPVEVWVQICIFQNPGATYDEVKQLVANARQHAAPNAKIYITGQPIYPDNPTSCFLAGPRGPQLTVDLAKRAGNDTALNVTYPGEFKLTKSEVVDECHANTAPGVSGKASSSLLGLINTDQISAREMRDVPNQKKHPCIRVPKTQVCCTCATVIETSLDIRSRNSMHFDKHMCTPIPKHKSGSQFNLALHAVHTCRRYNLRLAVVKHHLMNAKK